MLSNIIEQQLGINTSDAGLGRASRQHAENLRARDAIMPPKRESRKEKTRDPPMALGSVAYGLPTLALTRRTLDVQVR